MQRPMFHAFIINLKRICHFYVAQQAPGGLWRTIEWPSTTLCYLQFAVCFTRLFISHVTAKSRKIFDLLPFTVNDKIERSYQQRPAMHGTAGYATWAVRVTRPAGWGSKASKYAAPALAASVKMQIKYVSHSIIWQTLTLFWKKCV